MTTYTSTATTDGWILTATSTNGRTTYTIKEPSGSVIYNGSNPTGDIRKDSSLTRENQELFAPFGPENFTGLSINGQRNFYVAANGTVNTLLSSLGQMVQQTNTDIRTQQTTAAAPTPAPAPVTVTSSAPRPTNVTNTTNTTANTTSSTTVVTTPTTVTVITESSTTTTTGGSRTVTAPAPVAVASEPPLPPIKLEPITVDVPQFDSDGNQIGTSQVVIESPPTTTDPSRAPLPLGDDIDDIYDPNLTPEQIASLSPGDRRARENFFIEEAGGTPNTDGLGDVEADGTIVVTAERERANAFKARADWRVRLALSDDPSVNYLYKADNPGILNPLNATNGVIFPYTPTISVNYAANYNPTELVHSNYKVYQYSSSSIDTVTITGDFTAQDEYEANYLLAVIHFFRSATKMFYGQDESPRRGTPPPLCYIYGMGSYQFAGQPLAISQFSYNLPNNVDYITTSTGEEQAPSATTQPPRMAGTGVARGGVLPPPQFTPISEPGTISRVPSKIQLSVTCVPMMNRNSVSNAFSFKEYATGRLLNGIGKRFGGFW